MHTIFSTIEVMFCYDNNINDKLKLIFYRL